MRGDGEKLRVLVCVYVCVSVCLSVRALKEKQLELPTSKYVIHGCSWSACVDR